MKRDSEATARLKGGRSTCRVCGQLMSSRATDINPDFHTKCAKREQAMRAAFLKAVGT